MWRRAVVVVGIAVVGGCSSDSRRIEYVIPDGYRGCVWILHDPDAPLVPVVNGRHQVVFPADGVFRVGSMKPFEKWHEASARFADGKSLPANLVSGSVKAAPDTVAMWAGARGATWPYKRDYIAWVVGTEADFKAVGKEFAPRAKSAPPIKVQPAE